MPKEKEVINEEGLLKAISSYLDNELEKAKGEEVEKADGEDADAKKAKPFEGKETKEEEEKEEEEGEKKCKKGDAEGGTNRIKPGDAEVDKIGKKSFDDDEYKEYQMLKKAKEEADLQKAQEANEVLQKSVTDLTSMVTGLKEQIEALSKQPARAPKSVDGVKFLKKSETDGQEDKTPDTTNTDVSAMPKGLLKARVAYVMFEEGVKKGKLSASDVAEYEATGSLLDPNKKMLVKSLVNEEIKKGNFGA